MNTIFKKFKVGTKEKNKKLDAELAFFYNISVPDLLLLTAGISIIFAILLAVF